MPKYRKSFPHLLTSTFMTDGGIETDLIFNRGIDLPEFAAFDLLKNEKGREILKSYFIEYLEISKVHYKRAVSRTAKTNRGFKSAIGQTQW